MTKGFVKEQNARKQTPLEILFYCLLHNITLPIGTFLKAWLAWQ